MKDKPTKIITCTKVFPDVPFAHRQPNHTGHCRLIHGHNWTFEITWIAREPDECGFVVDFGKLQEVKGLLNQWDHALLLNKDDPLLRQCHKFLADAGIQNIVAVPDCSAEGLAELVFRTVDKLIGQLTGGRVSVLKVVVREDSKNSATCEVAL